MVEQAQCQKLWAIKQRLSSAAQVRFGQQCERYGALSMSEPAKPNYDRSAKINWFFSPLDSTLRATR